jgi:hypothetical protein
MSATLSLAHKKKLAVFVLKKIYCFFKITFKGNFSTKSILFTYHYIRLNELNRMFLVLKCQNVSYEKYIYNEQ